VSKIASEMLIARRFAKWLSHSTSQAYTVTRGPNPPDFLLNPGTWLELTNIYLSDKQAKFLNSPEVRRFRFRGSPEKLSFRLLKKLDEKLAKTSYRAVHQERGPGVLLLSCQDCFFDEVILNRVQKAVISFKPRDDRGFFRRAYFEYRLPASDHVYEIIYPASEVRIVDATGTGE
jgi:hypothetical protein